jgi:hypothetical protein
VDGWMDGWIIKSNLDVSIAVSYSYFFEDFFV